MAPTRCTETNTARSQRAELARLGRRAGALTFLAGLGLLAAAAALIELSGPARARAPTPTIVAGSPSSPPPKNVWIALGGSPPAPVLASARKIVACVRRHGIPNFPNPKVSGEMVFLILPTGLSRTSPRLKKARRACQKFLPAPPGGPTRTGPSLQRAGQSRRN
jgi:hypothetical protein